MTDNAGVGRRDFLATCGGIALGGSIGATDAKGHIGRGPSFRPSPGRPYRLLNVASAKAMDVELAATTSGAPVIQYHWKGAACADVNQHWYFLPLDGQHERCYAIVPGTNPRLALTANRAGQDDGSQLRQTLYERRPDQAWKLKSLRTPGERSWVLMVKGSRLVASVPEGSLEDFAPVTCCRLTAPGSRRRPIASQRWYISEVNVEPRENGPSEEPSGIGRSGSTSGSAQRGTHGS